MSRTIAIDPLTRLEGHLAVKVEVENGRVAQAWCSGEMFRGFENILRGRDPMDAQQITQRICGVCPVSHGTASIFAQDEAYKIVPTTNGRLLRNLILAANYLQSHIIHFYQLSALDFIDITAIASYKGSDLALLALRDWVVQQSSAKVLHPGAPFLPRYEGTYVEDSELNLQAIRHYLEALEIRKTAHKMVAIFGGKAPHPASLIPGGVSGRVSMDQIAAYEALLRQVRNFVEHTYIPDVVEVAKLFPQYFTIGKGPASYLSYGNFPDADNGKERFFSAGTLDGAVFSALDERLITESVESSFFSSRTGLGPYEGETVPAPGKGGAYSWLKAPRYAGKPMEVGPLARVLVACEGGTGTAPVKALVNDYLHRLGAGPEVLNSVMGRHLARALEAKLIADKALEWIGKVVPEKPCATQFTIPQEGRGAGLMEAPRGALGHWLVLKNAKIANYQCVVPTTWNCSPRDEKGVPGPVEQALKNTPIADAENPIEAARVVRSFDPCLACAVH